MIIQILQALLLIILVAGCVVIAQYVYRVAKIPANEYKTIQQRIRRGDKITHEEWVALFSRR